jgi:hypothetical protein
MILGLALSFRGSSANIYVFPISIALLLALIFLKIISRIFSISQNENLFGIMFILSIILAIPCAIYAYAKVLVHFTK